MKKLIAKGPIFIFQVVAAIVLVVLAYCLVGYFVRQDAVVEHVSPPMASPEIAPKEKEEIEYISPNELGIVHVELDSPSYAKSNFDINPDTNIVVYYNVKQNPQDALRGFKLSDKNTGEETAAEISYIDRQEVDNKDSYEWAWQEVWERKLIFAPVKKLESISMYEINLQMGEGKVFRYEFLTADDPGILSTNLDNKDFQIEVGEPIKVIFKSPMVSEELVNKVKIYPEGVNFSIDAVDKIMTIEGAFGLRSYQLVVPADVKDIYGRELGREFIVSFEVI